MTAGSLERNLQLIPYHQALASSMVYLPVFVLFTRDNFGVSGALQIASLTYLFIVALEVPSGWMSDRLGRVPTLSVAAAGFAIGQVCFLLGGEQFGLIVLGQFFVSSGYAFISGTDVSFHFDSLEALGRRDEYARRQARISSLSYLVRAGTAIVGAVVTLCGALVMKTGAERASKNVPDFEHTSQSLSDNKTFIKERLTA